MKDSFAIFSFYKSKEAPSSLIPVLDESSIPEPMFCNRAVIPDRWVVVITCMVPGSAPWPPGCQKATRQPGKEASVVRSLVYVSCIWWVSTRVVRVYGVLVDGGR